MANGLFPVFDVPSTLVEETKQQTQYAPVPMWDMEAGDFVTDGAGRTLYGSGYDAWVLWCTKSILTQRWAHDGYNANEGIEAEQAFKEPDREAIESAFERTITEALLADPMGRTAQVRDFEFTWEADSLCIECIVIGTDGDTASIKAKLNT
ncbi:MAG: DUF2634 domain-containing protein [Hungatella sp.]|nr:DUF2634 domain-containing protein [Hungatella sp.]